MSLSHFAKIAFKNSYDHTELDGFRRECYSENFDPLSNIEVGALLGNTKMSADGCDGIPAWLLRSCSYEHHHHHLFNNTVDKT